MKRKIFMIILTLVISLLLVACNSEEVKVEHTLDFIENENCNISLSHLTAYKGDEITVSVEDIVEGYEVSKITVNDYFIDDFKFIMPDEDVIIEVYLEEIKINLNGEFKAEVESNEYALIELNGTRFNAGDIVKINYYCKGNYVLDKFYVNGVAISGTSFAMPSNDVVVTGEFVNAIAYTDWQLEVYSGTNAGRSYWYFSYGEDRLNVKVIVVDHMVCGSQFQANTGMQDNVEVILGAKTSSTGYEVGKTIKVLVSGTGGHYVQVANSSTGWANKNITIGASAVKKLYDNNNGYNGYEVNFYLKYSDLGLTKENAIGNITACLAMRNTNGYSSNVTVWGSYTSYGCTWNNPSTHLIINADGSIGERS